MPYTVYCVACLVFTCKVALVLSQPSPANLRSWGGASDLTFRTWNLGVVEDAVECPKTFPWAL